MLRILSGPELRITAVPGVAVDRRGRILITDLHPEVLVFDSTGTFIRAVGRKGEGPGEYQFLSHTNVGPRYIHVFDFDRGRTLLNQDFEFVRTDRFAGRYLHYACNGVGRRHLFRRCLFGGLGRAQPAYPERVRRDVLLHGGSGVFRGQTLAGTYSVAADSRTLWVVETNPNRMTRWDLVPEPRKAVVYRRAVEEFDRHTFDPLLHPNASNSASLLDDHGLWILWTAPDPAFERRRGGGELPPEPPQNVRDTWLDLVDPATGLTLARHHSDGSAFLFAKGSRYVVFYHETDAGEPYIVLMEPKLTRGLPPRR